MFQGVQSIALAMAQEFGFTREIEDRVQAPCPIWLVAMAKVLSGAAQGVLSAAIVLPIASVVHAPGVRGPPEPALVDHRDLRAAGLHRDGRARAWCSGTSFEPRNIGLMFGFIILPITFLGGTYYSWTKLAPVTVGGWHWLQTLVLINPLIYVNEGMRAAFTDAPHMHLYVIYPVVAGFAALFLHRPAQLPPPRFVPEESSARSGSARSGPVRPGTISCRSRSLPMSLPARCRRARASGAVRLACHPVPQPPSVIVLGRQGARR